MDTGPKEDDRVEWRPINHRPGVGQRGCRAQGKVSLGSWTDGLVRTWWAAEVRHDAGSSRAYPLSGSRLCGPTAEEGFTLLGGSPEEKLPHPV